jgi:hypothetical protein
MIIYLLRHKIHDRWEASTFWYLFLAELLVDTSLISLLPWLLTALKG